MQIDEVLRGVDCVRRAGAAAEVTGVEYDSRRVSAGALFVAMHGGTTDGNRYIAAAVERGAGAVVTDSAAAFDRVQREHPGLAVAEVRHGRRALAELAANFFRHPERELKLSGVTGTNGKTTTAFLLDALLNHHRRKTVLVGTIEYHVAGEVRESPHTTPESRDLLELLREGVDRGATEAVMEVSSHALDQGRVWAMPYDVAIFTNLTQDHLDYHGTMENYFRAKQALFDGSLGRAPRVAVVNADDAFGAKLAEVAARAGAKVYRYGYSAGDFHADEVEMTPAGMRFTLRAPQGSASIESRLTGRVNVYNLLAASAAGLARGLTLEEIAAAAHLPAVPGRFQTVHAGQPFTVVVDYAHTDDALRNLIALARDFVAPHAGRVITLFGCGGDRDRTKRPLMGRVAGEGSDYVVATSDNPRSEDPVAILADVLPGLEATHTMHAVEPDRRAAIALALNAATPGDIVLIAGKGHERVQVLKDGPVSFDDAEVAAGCLAALGYAGSPAPNSAGGAA
jgi:UDP-N-acetylmuramoyl-L-alanyl-D-glutamate--2,6-diaminopimelate ligase